MISLKLFLFIYLLGGLTFIPLVVYVVFIALPKVQDNDLKSGTEEEHLLHKDGNEKKNYDLLNEIDPDLKAGAFEEKVGVSTYKEGKIVITRQCYYHPTCIPKDKVDSPEYLPLSKLNKPKFSNYCVLKHGNLFLYTDDSARKMKSAIVLSDCIITVWPNNELIPERSAFTKRTCIAIFKSRLYDENLKKIVLPNSNLASNSMFFLYFDNNFEKEDWYFALMDASKSTRTATTTTTTSETMAEKLPMYVSPPDAAHFKTKDMNKLIQLINSTENQLSTKWLNAIIGRLFLSYKENGKLGKIIENKIYSKLNKINTPGFLDDFKINHLYPGDIAPVFTNPKTVKMGIEGDFEVSLDVIYNGNLSLQMSTVATLGIVGFKKPKSIELEVRVTLKSLVGRLLIFMKRPPSNRIWYCFENEPEMDLSIEPVVSNRNLSYNVITSAIKSKIQEALKDSLVYPFMDDSVYYTMEEFGDYFYKGGIWDLSENNINLKKQKLEQLNKHEPNSVKDSKDLKDKVNEDSNDNKTNSKESAEQFQQEAEKKVLQHDLVSKINSSAPLRSVENKTEVVESLPEFSQHSEYNVHGNGGDDDDDVESLASQAISENRLETTKGRALEKVDTIKNFFKGKENVDETNSLSSQTETNKYSKKLGKWAKTLKDTTNNLRAEIAQAQSKEDTTSAKITSYTVSDPKHTEGDPYDHGLAVAAATAVTNTSTPTETPLLPVTEHVSAILTQTHDVVSEIPHAAPEMIFQRRVKRVSVSSTTSADPQSGSKDAAFSIKEQKRLSIPADMFVKQRDVMHAGAETATHHSVPNSPISPITRKKTVHVNGLEQELKTVNRPAPPELPARN